MSENKQKGIRISTLINEISSLKPESDNTFDISDVYNDVYDLRLMSCKYCSDEAI